MCTLWARGRMNDESGCLFACWSLSEGAKGEQDKIVVLAEREGKLKGFSNSERERSSMRNLRRGETFDVLDDIEYMKI